MNRIIFSAVLAIGTAISSVAQATSIVLPCVLNVRTGETDYSGGDSFGNDQAGLQGWSEWPGGVVTYHWRDNAGVARGVLAHCASRNYVVYGVASNRGSFVQSTMDGMAGSTQEFTQSQLMDALRNHGAQVAEGRSNVARCPCGN